LRVPTQHTVHNLVRGRGLVQVLSEGKPLGSLVQATEIEGLHLLCAGPETPNPAELLMSARFGEMIAEARQAYDLVIVDSPPILLVTDSAIVGTQVDGIMLVVRVGQTKRHNAQRAVDA